MRNVIMLLAAVSLSGVVATPGFADTEAQALIKSCEQQSQAAGDQYAAVMSCLHEKLQYDTSDSGE